MPVSKSAKKRVLQAKKATKRNYNLRNSIRTKTKDLKKLISSKTGKPAEIAKEQSKLHSLLDTAVKKNVFHKNKTARRKSAMAKLAKDNGVKIAQAKKKAEAKK